MDERLLLGIAAIIVTIALVFVAVRGEPEHDWREVVYVVEQGDTLWSICAPHCPADMDMWEYIDLVKQESGIHSSEIRKGQRITLLIDER